jgi:hypothetical protein
MTEAEPDGIETENETERIRGQREDDLLIATRPVQGWATVICPVVSRTLPP